MRDDFGTRGGAGERTRLTCARLAAGTRPESSHLRAIAAVPHVAPLPAVIAAGVEEHPSAFRPAALTQFRQLSRREQLGRRPGDGPDRLVERIPAVPGPAETIAHPRP